VKPQQSDFTVEGKTGRDLWVFLYFQCDYREVVWYVIWVWCVGGEWSRWFRWVNWVLICYVWAFGIVVVRLRLQLVGHRVGWFYTYIIMV